MKYTVHRYIHNGKFSVMLSEVLRENCMEACKFAHACCLSVCSITTDTELAWLNPNSEQCCAAIDYVDIQKWRLSDMNSFMSSQLNTCRFSCFFPNIMRVEYVFSSTKKCFIAVRLMSNVTLLGVLVPLQRGQLLEVHAVLLSYTPMLTVRYVTQTLVPLPL